MTKRLGGPSDNQLGHQQTAVDLERAALRLRYVRPEPRGISIGHHNLADYLGDQAGNRAERRGHRLAAALIWQLAGIAQYLDATAGILAAEMREDTGDPSLPSTVAHVAAIADRTEGVHLSALLSALQPEPHSVDTALEEIQNRATRGQD